MEYDKFIIVGSGDFAFQCAFYLIEKKYKVVVYEYKIAGISILEKKCTAANIEYFCFTKAEMTQWLVKNEEKTLIISVLNTYLFPPEVVNKQRMVIINCHNALLPCHPGRNAEAWAIFEEDKKTGVTWHFVNSNVDGGAVIMQREIALDNQITALKLLKKQNLLGLQMFKDLMEQIEKGWKYEPQTAEQNLTVMHRSYESPNNGMLDCQWTAEKIWAFLRAMDYAGLYIMGIPYIIFEGKKYCWKKYDMTLTHESEGIYMVGNTICIIKENKKIVLRKVEVYK